MKQTSTEMLIVWLPRTSHETIILLKGFFYIWDEEICWVVTDKQMKTTVGHRYKYESS